ncbi:MAG: UDP-N-acetylmuramate dehydrogenase [Bacteroidota bacterium]
MHIVQNQSLKPYNTFGIDVSAAHFASFQSIEELRQLLGQDSRPILLLGGGSNLLLTRHWEGLALHNGIKGRKVIREFAHCVYVEAGGGENWHAFVQWALERELGGIENLSLIPGTVGAAPIQNIGAYGVELKDVFVRLEAIDLSTGERRIFRKNDCQFGYRDSIFKRAAKGQYCITRVVFRLQKKHAHRLHLTYGAIRQTLADMSCTEVDIQAISQAVIHIRSSKLPDPAKLGNAGSFFKNPEISAQQFAPLQKKHPNIPHYPLGDDRIKVPAGWLIEQCGWKGKRIGHTGSHARQALVLVNYGEASGSEIWQLAQDIIASVQDTFGIGLQAEVNVL